MILLEIFWYASESAFNLCSKTFKDEKWNILECDLELDDKILHFNISPTLIGKLLRVQDYMVLKLIHDIGLKRPIYFAATVASNNQLGLEKYLCQALSLNSNTSAEVQ